MTNLLTRFINAFKSNHICFFAVITILEKGVDRTWNIGFILSSESWLSWLVAFFIDNRQRFKWTKSSFLKMIWNSFSKYLLLLSLFIAANTLNFLTNANRYYTTKLLVIFFPLKYKILNSKSKTIYASSKKILTVVVQILADTKAHVALMLFQ